MGGICKFITFSSFLLISIIIGVFWKELGLITTVGAGYGAKNACSIVFVANRSLESAYAAEFSFPPVSYLFYFEVDERNQCVTAKSRLGLFQRSACFRSKRLGCSLVFSLEELENFISSTSNENIQPMINQNDLWIPSNQNTSTILIKEPSTDEINKPWPLGNYIDNKSLTTLRSQHPINWKELDQIVNDHFLDEQLQARALILVRNNQIIYERYAESFNDQSLLLGWSMTKSILASLIYIRIEQGFMSLNQTVDLPWFLPNDQRRLITIRDLLRMSDGFDFEEDYLPWSDVPRMLYNSPSAAHFAGMKSLRKMNNQIQRCFHYSSGTTNVLSYLLRLSFHQQYSDPQEAQAKYIQFAFDEFFFPLGMHSAVFELDPIGTYLGSSYSWATARDWAKLGLLYLNHGKTISGSQLFPNDWVEFSSTAARSSRGFYGGHFWLGGKYEESSEELEIAAQCDLVYPSRLFPPKDKWRKLPDSSYFAHGFEEQIILISPEHNTVLIRLGCTNELLKWDKGQFYQQIFATIPLLNQKENS